MRYWMNMAIEIMENVENNTSSDDFISCQQELKACLMKSVFLAGLFFFLLLFVFY